MEYVNDIERSAISSLNEADYNRYRDFKDVLLGFDIQQMRIDIDNGRFDSLYIDIVQFNNDLRRIEAFLLKNTKLSENEVFSIVALISKAAKPYEDRLIEVLKEHSHEHLR